MKHTSNIIKADFKNFGKTLVRCMSTTALTATGLMALAAPASADDNMWSQHDYTQGAAVVDLSVPDTTNITLLSDSVTARGDGDIKAGYTVNINGKRYVLFDTESDPTHILGNLNSNGEVFIFDQNGVIFGKGSVVNVTNIVAASTDGFVQQEAIDGSTLELNNVESGGDIELNGTINVTGAGIAAFVAPSVVNSGVINAKMGNVVLASGNAVTLDMYGDGLVEVAVDGALENSLIENKGTINAEGGTVNITAAAAKDVVDNVINMDGVIDVSSVSMKGGKIILSGGSKGTVSVSGKLDASGTQGGDVAITGQNIDMANGSEIWADASSANGNGGNILVYGNDYAIMSGSIVARGGRVSGNGGSAEVSAGQSVGYYGFADLSAQNGVTGTFLIDPKTLNINTNITSGTLADVISGGNSTVNINDQALANTLRFSNVNLWATQDLNITSDIDISTWKGLLGAKGITAKDLTLAAPTVNVSYDVILGTGKLNIFDLAGGTSVLGFGILNAPAAGVEVDVVNLDGTIYKRSTVSGAKSVAGDGQINSQANTVNVLSNNAKIQQGIWFSNDVGGGVINVASGTYNESITVDRDVTLNGANSGVNPNTGVRVAETIIDPNSPGFYVTADGVLIDGFTITSADDGVLVDSADNVTIKNNIIHDVTQNGIEFINSLGGEVSNNRIDNTGDSAVLIKNGSNFTVDNNYIGQDVGSTIKGNGVLIENVTGGTVKRNLISNATQVMATDRASGVYLDNSRDIIVGGTNKKDGNVIKNSDWDGIKIKSGSGNTAQFNNIDESTRAGIYTEASNNLNILDNTINDSNVFGGVGVLGGENINVRRNTIIEKATSTAGNGIIMTLVTGGVNNIINNTVHAINGFGVNVNNSTNIIIARNDVYDTKDDGITVRDVNGNVAVRNNVVGMADGSSFIEGNGISLYRIDGANVFGNEVYHTKNTSFSPTNGNGILLKDSSSIDVGKVGSGNHIRNANWDGIKVDGGSNNNVVGNNIAGSTRVGVYGVGTNSLSVTDNFIDNSGVTAGIGFEYGRNVTINNNEVKRSTDNGIYVNESKGNIAIAANKVTDTNGFGITVENSDTSFTGILFNKITDTNDDGITVRDTTGTISVSNNIVGAANGSSFIEGNGISLYRIDGANIVGNEIYHTKTVESDHASGIYLGDSHRINVGLTGKNKGNYIRNADWDGVKVTGGSENIVNNNDISDSTRVGVYGVATNDLIVKNNLIRNSNTTAGVGIYYSRNVEIDNNDIAYSYDDGIHVEETKGNIRITNNTVDESADDGIEVVGSTDVLIDTNVVSNSGDDGINVLGFRGFYTKEYDDSVDFEGDVKNPEDFETFARVRMPIYELPLFSAKIINNTIADSGNDGIESRGFDVLTVLSNNVTDSLANGLYVSGFNNGSSTVSGNTFTNNDIGAHFESGLVDLTGTGNTFNNGRVGLRFAPFAFSGEEGGEGELEMISLSLPTSIYDVLFPYPFMTPSSGFAPLSLVDNDGGPNSESFPVVPPTNYGGTIGAQTFVGQSQYYVELDNGAFFEPGTPTWLNGMNSSYDGIIPANDLDGLLDQAAYDTIESKIFHFVDRQDVGLFFFGLRGEDTAAINQNQIFNRFGAFTGNVTGLNVRITGLPTIPGGGTPAQNFNDINTFAGGTETSAADLNNIQTAAGGDDTTQDLNEIQTESGGNSDRCWTNAVNNAGNGQAASVIYTGTLDDALSQAQDCAGTL